MSQPDTELTPTHITRKAVQGTLWTYLAYVAGKLISFVTTVVLARLLVPQAFGLVGYASVVIQYLEVVNTLGMGTALVARRDRVEEAANAAFALSVAGGSLLYGLIWLGAPLVARYFREPAVVPMLRALGLILPLHALGVVPAAFLQRELRFGIRVIPDLTSSVARGVVSIALAGLGYGAWSLVWGQLVSEGVADGLSWLLARWRPTWRFHPEVTRQMLTYGVHIVTVGFIGALLNNVDYLIVGRALGATALGLYTIAYRMPELAVRSVNMVAGQVAFPLLAAVQRQAQMIHLIYQRYIRYLALFVFPVGVGVALLADPIIRVFYTAKWAEAIPVMRWVALALTVGALGHVPGVLYKAINRPDILNKLALVKLPVVVAALAYATRWGIAGVAAAHLGLAFFKVGLDLGVARYFVPLGFRDLLAGLRPILLATAVMSGAVWAWVHLVPGTRLEDLLGGVLIGAGVYLGTLFFVRRELVHHLVVSVWQALQTSEA